MVNLLYQSQNKIKLLCHYLVCLYLLDTDFRLSGVTLHSIIESTFFLHKKIIKTIKCCSSWLWHITGFGWTKNQEVCRGGCLLFEPRINYNRLAAFDWLRKEHVSSTSFLVQNSSTPAGSYHTSPELGPQPETEMNLPLNAGSKLNESDLSFCLIEWINISKGALVIFINFYGLLICKNYLFKKVLDHKLYNGAKIGKVWGKSYIRFQCRPWENIFEMR